MTDQEQFEEIFTTHITRQGSTELLEWMKKTDFFTAPASTRFHCACKGGLLKHSINVYRVLRERYFEEGDSEESLPYADYCMIFVKLNSTKNPLETSKMNRLVNGKSSLILRWKIAFPTGMVKNLFL